MRVKEIMTPEPYCCAILEPVQNAARMMKDWDVGSLPVVADQHSWKLKGIVTDRDLPTTVASQRRDQTSIAAKTHTAIAPFTDG